MTKIYIFAVQKFNYVHQYQQRLVYLSLLCIIIKKCSKPKTAGLLLLATTTRGRESLGSWV